MMVTDTCACSEPRGRDFSPSGEPLGVKEGVLCPQRGCGSCTLRCCTQNLWQKVHPKPCSAVENHEG